MSEPVTELLSKPAAGVRSGQEPPILPEVVPENLGQLVSPNPGHIVAERKSSIVGQMR